jgi:hypothetical protein
MKSTTKTPRATSANTNPAIVPIEAAAKSYADARGVLAGTISRYEAELAKLQAAFLPLVNVQAAQAATARATLEGRIDANRSLFDNPRTITLHGIKLGLQKGKGRVEWADETKLVQRIFGYCSDDQVNHLLEVTYTPRKDALATLDASLLKKLGVTITDTGDQVVIKAAGTDVEKFVAKFTAAPAKGKKEAA